MAPILDYLLVVAAVLGAVFYLFFNYRGKKCGGCLAENRKRPAKKIQIQLPKR
jgi:hypothetical protein